MSDLDLPLRGRTYREPEGPHVAVTRGRELDAGLEHLDARPDCRALGVLGPLPKVPDLTLLAGRRLLVWDTRRESVREFAEAGIRAGAEVDWLASEKLDLGRFAAWALPVAAVVLAAGAARRMGANKLLLEVGERPLVRHVIEAASEGGCHSVYAVYSDAAVLGAIRRSAIPVLNPEARSGQASSLRRGLQALPEAMAGALVMLGDQPLVGSRTVRLLLSAWRREGARPAVAAGYGGADGWLPPVVLERHLWPELMALTGDAGARRLFERRPELVDTVPAAGRADDVDTPQDYAKIVQLFPRVPRRDPG